MTPLDCLDKLLEEVYPDPDTELIESVGLYPILEKDDKAIILINPSSGDEVIFFIYDNVWKYAKISRDETNIPEHSPEECGVTEFKFFISDDVIYNFSEQNQSIATFFAKSIGVFGTIQ